MTKELETLLRMYTINSKSGMEKTISEFVKTSLSKEGIPFAVDKKNQVFTPKKLYNPSKPLLVAHLDQVQTTSPSKLSDFLIIPEVQAAQGNLLMDQGKVCQKNRKVETSIEAQAAKGNLLVVSAPGFGLGADDKNGVWIILTLLHHVNRHLHISRSRCFSGSSESWTSSSLPFNFIFSVGEEVASRSVLDAFQAMTEGKQENYPCFALVLDRKGSRDIIGAMNGYCSVEFEDALHRFSIQKNHGYRPEMGVFSDADALSEYINCVNLSVGYERAHTKDECTFISALYRSRRFVWDIVLNAAKFSGLPKKSPKRTKEPTTFIEFTESELNVLAEILFNEERKGIEKKKETHIVSSMLDKVYDEIYAKQKNSLDWIS